LCESEDEARSLIQTLPKQGKWPCLFAGSTTTGEKDFEEFFTDNETLDMQRFNNLGVIKNELNVEEDKLHVFEEKIHAMLSNKQWNKEEIVDLFNYMMPNFGHKETGLYLDGKM
jgi:FlaA1/EpsC-like NDP-sugar epimerase